MDTAKDFDDVSLILRIESDKMNSIFFMYKELKIPAQNEPELIHHLCF